METEHLETETNLRFFEILRQYSDNQYDPLPEWELVLGKFMEKESRCICSTPIERNFYICHKRTGKELVIGSECVKRWINPKLICKQCKCPLGRFAARIKTQDFLCPSCKRIAKKAVEEKERKTLSRIQTLGRFKFFFGKIYFAQRFCEVVKDIPYVEFILNHPWIHQPETIKLFLEYVHLVYDIKETVVEN